MSKKQSTITIYFKWASVEADPRNYKPARPVLLPEGNQRLAVEVPLNREHIFNATEIITKQFDADGSYEPILTPLGLKYCVDQLEAPFAVETNVEVETINDEDFDEEWDKF